MCVRRTTSSDEVERVLHRPRRVVGRDVERREVVVVELDLGALDDVEAHAQEDVLDLAPGLGDQVQVAGRQRRVAGQRDVDAVLGQAALELGVLERGRALAEHRLERLAHLVRGLADRAALLRRQVADAAQDAGQLGLAAQVADAQLLERGGLGGGGDGGLRLAAQLVEAGGRVSHRRAILVRS